MLKVNATYLEPVTSTPIHVRCLLLPRPSNLVQNARSDPAESVHSDPHMLHPRCGVARFVLTPNVASHFLARGQVGGQTNVTSKVQTQQCVCCSLLPLTMSDYVHHPCHSIMCPCDFATLS
jgi:hypothetical protein